MREPPPRLLVPLIGKILLSGVAAANGVAPKWAVVDTRRSGSERPLERTSPRACRVNARGRDQAGREPGVRRQRTRRGEHMVQARAEWRRGAWPEGGTGRGASPELIGVVMRTPGSRRARVRSAAACRALEPANHYPSPMSATTAATQRDRQASAGARRGHGRRSRRASEVAAAPGRQPTHPSRPRRSRSPGERDGQTTGRRGAHGLVDGDVAIGTAGAATEVACVGARRGQPIPQLGRLRWA